MNLTHCTISRHSTHRLLNFVVACNQYEEITKPQRSAMEGIVTQPAPPLILFWKRRPENVVFSARKKWKSDEVKSGLKAGLSNFSHPKRRLIRILCEPYCACVPTGHWFVPCIKNRTSKTILRWSRLCDNFLHHSVLSFTKMVFQLDCTPRKLSQCRLQLSRKIMQDVYFMMPWYLFLLKKNSLCKKMTKPSFGTSSYLEQCITLHINLVCICIFQSKLKFSINYVYCLCRKSFQVFTRFLNKLYV